MTILAVWQCFVLQPENTCIVQHWFVNVHCRAYPVCKHLDDNRHIIDLLSNSVKPINLHYDLGTKY